MAQNKAGVKVRFKTITNSNFHQNTGQHARHSNRSTRLTYLLCIFENVLQEIILVSPSCCVLHS